MRERPASEITKAGLANLLRAHQWEVRDFLRIAGKADGALGPDGELRFDLDRLVWSIPEDGEVVEAFLRET